MKDLTAGLPRVVTLLRLSEKKLALSVAPCYTLITMRLLKQLNHDTLMQAVMLLASFVAGWLTVALQHG